MIKVFAAEHNHRADGRTVGGLSPRGRGREDTSREKGRVVSLMVTKGGTAVVCLGQRPASAKQDLTKVPRKNSWGIHRATGPTRLATAGGPGAKLLNMGVRFAACTRPGWFWCGRHSRAEG